MSERSIAERVGPEVAAPRPSSATPIERLDRTISEAERRLEEHETLIRQAVLAGRDAGQETLDLQKMQLLLAILREGRERLRELPQTM